MAALLSFDVHCEGFDRWDIALTQKTLPLADSVSTEHERAYAQEIMSFQGIVFKNVVVLFSDAVAALFVTICRWMERANGVFSPMIAPSSVVLMTLRTKPY